MQYNYCQVNIFEAKKMFSIQYFFKIKELQLEISKHFQSLHCISCACMFHIWARPGGWSHWRAPGGRVSTLVVRSDTVRRRNMRLPLHGLTACEMCQAGRVQCELDSSQRWGPWWSDLVWSWQTSSRDVARHLSSREVTRAGVWGWKFRLDIVRLLSTHSLGSGTSPLETDWTVFR